MFVKHTEPYPENLDFSLKEMLHHSRTQNAYSELIRESQSAQLTRIESLLLKNNLLAPSEVMHD